MTAAWRAANLLKPWALDRWQPQAAKLQVPAPFSKPCLLCEPGKGAKGVSPGWYYLGPVDFHLFG